jgi:taurine dioxygenase
MLSLRPCTEALGVEVSGLDLTSPEESDVDLILELLGKHHVLFFSDQSLTPDSQVALAQRFGELHVHPFLDRIGADNPAVTVLEGDRPVADNWHTDGTFVERPPWISILRMVTSPQTGGDTQWSNQELAYRSLDPDVRARLHGMTALHETPDRDRRVVHPVVRSRARTDRPALFVNRFFTTRIVELSERESSQLLAELFDIAESSALCCQHRWSDGDVAIWDNTSTQHRVATGYREMRRVERVSIRGPRPVAPVDIH